MKNRAVAKWLFGVMALLSFVGLSAEGWGPMAHMKVNTLAYNRASAEMGSSIVIPPEMKDSFIGAGPSPDIRQNAGSPLLDRLHHEIPLILSILEYAKKDPKINAQDIAELLGWAGHLFAEVPSFHSPTGYANTKKVFSLPGAGYANHSITEFCVDILTYQEMKGSLKSQRVTVPIKLLESWGQSSEAKSLGLKGLSAAELRDRTNSFLPTFIGIRTMADFLIRERPALLKEMDAFFADRRLAFDTSVEDVTLMLVSYGRKDFSKPLNAGTDAKGKFGPITGSTFSEKIRNFSLNGISKWLEIDFCNEYISRIGAGVMKGMLSTGFMRQQFMKLAQHLEGDRAKGNDPNKVLVKKFMEALLLHKEFTLRQIIAFAEDGLNETP
ncbi:MAG: hypothetical protein WA705_15710 [Candidatus Ozemobacteraceae bacterium]